MQNPVKGLPRHGLGWVTSGKQEQAAQRLICFHQGLNRLARAVGQGHQPLPPALAAHHECVGLARQRHACQ